MHDTWIQLWKLTTHSIEGLGGKIKGPLVIEEKASELEILEVEKELGLTLPASFRDTLLLFSKHVEFSWYLDKTVKLPDGLDRIRYGRCFWSLDDLPKLERGRKEWVANCFPNPGNPYDKIWHEKLAFLGIANGDYLVFDMNTPGPDKPIVYLSHEDLKEHGYILGQNFEEFIDNWSKVGCPGPEGWVLSYFLESPTSGINPDNDKAKKWRSFLGLTTPG